MCSLFNLFTYNSFRLRKANAPRVVNVSSLAAYYAKIHFDDIQYERAKWYLFSQVYSQSKLAILAFTEELQRRSDAKGWGLTGMLIIIFAFINQRKYIEK